MHKKFIAYKFVLVRIHKQIIKNLASKNVKQVSVLESTPVPAPIGIDTKICSNCREAKPISSFGKKGMRYGKQAYQTRCNPYRSSYDKERYNTDSSTILTRNNEYYKKNTKQIVQQHREYNKINSDAVKANKKRYYEENKEWLLAKHEEYMKTYYIRFPEKKLVQSARRRSNAVLKSKNRFNELLGCDSKFLQGWISFHAADDARYTMDNYGSGWHLDHVLPCAKWDMTNDDHIRKCFHWSNLAPLDAKENAAKKDKIIIEHINRQNVKLRTFTELHNIELVQISVNDIARPANAGSPLEF
jgi:hypothetical protein